MNKSTVKTQIDSLSKSATDSNNGVEALQFSQAALNLAHTLEVLWHINETDKEPIKTEKAYSELGQPEERPYDSSLITKENPYGWLDLVPGYIGPTEPEITP